MKNYMVECGVVNTVSQKKIDHKARINNNPWKPVQQKEHQLRNNIPLVGNTQTVEYKLGYGAGVLKKQSS